MAMVNSGIKPHVEEITFASDTFLLKGSLHIPPVIRPAVVIGSHGLFSDRTSPKQIALAQQCNLYHMAYFRIDHRGCGESEGNFEEGASLQARCCDVIAAAQMLKARDDIGNTLGLFGSSMGGAVCLTVARYLEADAVVTWAAPIRSTHIVQRKAARETSVDSNTPFKRHPFDISNALNGIQNILIFHGDHDQTVPLPHAQEIYGLVNETKKLVIFARSDHRMSNPADQHVFVRQSALWFQVHLKAGLS